jgi:hypothetical protein
MTDEKRIICLNEDCRASGAHISVFVESEDVTGSGICCMAACGRCGRAFDITEEEYDRHNEQIEHARAHAASVPHVH